MRQSLAVNIQPITLATVTTAMGFLSLNYCSSPAIYGFGNVVAIGVCWAYLVTLTLLPNLILLLPAADLPRPLAIREQRNCLLEPGPTRGVWFAVNGSKPLPIGRLVDQPDRDLHDSRRGEIRL